MERSNNRPPLREGGREGEREGEREGGRGGKGGGRGGRERGREGGRDSNGKGGQQIKGEWERGTGSRGERFIEVCLALTHPWLRENVVFCLQRVTRWRGL